ncbi:MAG: alpha/beta hydrolase family esterase [Thermoplasmatota archaeon]
MRWAVLVIVVALSGCLQANPEWNIQTEDGARFASYHIPEGDGPFPLLIALHGGLGTPRSMMDKSQFDTWADQEGFIVVYPEGMDRTWNAGHCCGKARDQNRDDVAFLEAVIDKVRSEHEISRIGVTGHSNGAMMAYRFAAERSEVDFVAVVAGAIGGQKNAFADPYEIPAPGRPVEVVIIHARDDPNVPYNGGSGPESVDPLRIDRSVDDAVAFWTQANQATLAHTSQEGDVTWERYEGMADVTLISTLGGHGWPGSAKQIALTDNPAAPDASEEIVRSFLD